MNIRPFFWVLLGALIAFVILKIMARASETAPSATTDRAKELLKTQQVANLVRTNEFSEVLKTTEFRNFAKTLAKEQALAMAEAIAG